MFSHTLLRLILETSITDQQDKYYHPSFTWGTKVKKRVWDHTAGSGPEVGLDHLKRISITGSGRSPGEGNGNPLQYYSLENPIVGGNLVGYTVHRVAKSDTTEQLHFHSCPKKGKGKEKVCVVGLREEVRQAAGSQEGPTHSTTSTSTRTLGWCDTVTNLHLHSYSQLCFPSPNWWRML